MRQSSSNQHSLIREQKMDLKNESVSIRVANNLQGALNELESVLDDLSMKEFYGTTNQENPEEAADRLVTEAARKYRVDKEALWAALKKTKVSVKSVNSRIAAMLNDPQIETAIRQFVYETPKLNMENAKVDTEEGIFNGWKITHDNVADDFYNVEIFKNADGEYEWYTSGVGDLLFSREPTSMQEVFDAVSAATTQLREFGEKGTIMGEDPMNIEKKLKKES
jgi:hypothetical protein